MQTQPEAEKPEQLAKVYHEVAERSAKILGEFARKNLSANLSAAVTDELGIAKALRVEPNQVLS